MIFYIWTPGFNSLSGGIMSLHRLAHHLCELGHESFLITDTKNPEWLGSLHDGYNMNPEGIAIYPEITVGNPYGLKKVIRWILNTPGVIGGDGVYGETDLVYKYAPYYTVPNESQVKGILTVMNDNRSKFIDLKQHISGKQCYIIRKGYYKTHDKHEINSINIDDYHIKGGDDYLIKVFNECETFISYDHNTYISTQAAMCGCISIVIPDEKTSSENWKNTFPYFKYGIAYGNNPEEIEYALTTQDLLREQIKELENNSINQIKQVLKDIEKQWNLL